jgi:hypothetical protein
MKIELTKEHIDKAIEEYIPGNIAYCCPVFQALKSQIPNIRQVAYTYAVVEDRRINLPEAIQRITRLARWQWKEIEPITFEVDYNENMA